MKEGGEEAEGGWGGGMREAGEGWRGYRKRGREMGKNVTLICFLASRSICLWKEKWCFVSVQFKYGPNYSGPSCHMKMKKPKIYKILV